MILLVIVLTVCAGALLFIKALGDASQKADDDEQRRREAEILRRYREEVPPYDNGEEFPARAARPVR